MTGLVFGVFLAEPPVRFGCIGPDNDTLAQEHCESGFEIAALVGPRGADGSAASRFEHMQTSPLAEWIVNHNLGFWPDVTLFSIGGSQVLAEVLHASLNQARVYFDDPFSGIAICE